MNVETDITKPGKIRIDWLAKPKSERFEIIKPETKTFMSMIWPMSDRYANPLNPVFLAQLNALSELNTAPVWIVRDGLVPLLWFFKLYPRPEGITSRLLVDDTLASYVPTAWRPVVGTYRLAVKKKPARNKGSFVLGLAMEEYCSLQHLDIQLKKIAKIRVNGLDNLAYMPCRLFHSDKDSRDTFHAKLFTALAMRFGSSLRYVRWDQLAATDSFDGYRIVDLNQRLLCADNAVVHFMLRRGAFLAGCPSREGRKGERYVPLSPHHGFLVNESIRGVDTRSRRHQRDYEKKMLGLMNSSVHGFFQWESLLTYWMSVSPQLAEERASKQKSRDH